MASRSSRASGSSVIVTMVMGVLPVAEQCAGNVALTPSDILTTQDIGLSLEGDSCSKLS